ncbi:MAG: amidohydrolase family protein [Thalassotalea sp.]|nr:amidohydrolase family protein [Thalassotalea sp.]
MDIIDPHLHLFDLTKGDYHWLQAKQAPFWPDKYKIHSNFSEQDLELDSNTNIIGFVHIEAGFNNQHPHREIQWLEQTCNLAFKSIAFLDITSNNFAEQLGKLKQFKSLVGIRHILDQQLLEILSQQHTLKNLQLLAASDLIFEAQFDIANANDCQIFVDTIKQCSNLKVVINHAGFAANNKIDEKYRDSLSLLASLDNCWIKCSGWEMQNRDWQTSDIKPLLELIITTFGIERVMLASNFPVSNLAMSYKQLWQKYSKELLANFSLKQKKQLSVDNAKLFYRFNLPS